MKRQEKMDPAQRDAYQTLLKELENLGEEAIPTRQILQLALQLDEKGEFYKFKDKKILSIRLKIANKKK